MLDNLPDRINNLSDAKSIRILEFYSTQLFEGMETTPEQMLAGIPDEFKDRAPFESVLKMSATERAKHLSKSESAPLAKELLMGFSKDSAFAPSLSEALDNYQDKNLMVGEILATGIALSMIIVAATTAFNGRIGNFKITKETADATFIEALFKHFPKIFKGD